MLHRKIVWHNQIESGERGEEKAEGKLNFPLAWSTCKKLTTENLSICHLIWRWQFFPLRSHLEDFFLASLLAAHRLRCLRRRNAAGNWRKKVNSNWIAIQFAFNSQLETSGLRSKKSFPCLLCCFATIKFHFSPLRLIVARTLFPLRLWIFISSGRQLWSVYSTSNQQR